MGSPIQTLEELQRLDLDICAIEQGERSLTERIGSINGALAELSAAKSAIAAEIEGINALIRDAAEKVRGSEEKIKRNETRLGQVKSDKEANALTRETTEANKAKKQADQEMASLNARLGEKEAQLAGKAADEAARGEELKLASEELEGNRGARKAALAEKLSRRDALVAAVPGDLLRRYEMIRSKRGGRAVVAVRDEACQGCFLHIPPQVYIELKKGGSELITCPHCHRILYVEARPAEQEKRPDEAGTAV